jgi:hypothetical protein
MERDISSRRVFLCSSLAGVAVLACGRRVWAAPKVEIIGLDVISPPGDLYSGWPTLARRRSGELLLVASGGREAHVCPFGRVELMRSSDGGVTWSFPRTALDGPIDDRDAGVLETATGALLVTTFTSLAYEPILSRAEKIAPGDPGAWDAARLKRWRGVHHRVDAAGRRAALGVWMIRSTDGGITWSGRYDSLVNSPHGPVQLSDGRLLYAGKDLWRDGHRVGVCQSTDDGKSWSWLATISPRDGDSHENYHELHAVEAKDGRIIVQIRNHNTESSRETLQCESVDGGKTWTKPRSIGVWGLPSHLLRLRDDRLLMSYGHRRTPFGNQVRISDDHGRAWSDPLLISNDGIGGDLGYPSTVELDTGAFVSVWYERMKSSPRAILRQARWKLV